MAGGTAYAWHAERPLHKVQRALGQSAGTVQKVNGVAKVPSEALAGRPAVAGVTAFSCQPSLVPADAPQAGLSIVAEVNFTEATDPDTLFVFGTANVLAEFSHTIVLA